MKQAFLELRSLKHPFLAYFDQRSRFSPGSYFRRSPSAASLLLCFATLRRRGNQLLFSPSPEPFNPFLLKRSSLEAYFVGFFFAEAFFFSGLESDSSIFFLAGVFFGAGLAFSVSVIIGVQTSSRGSGAGPPSFFLSRISSLSTPVSGSTTRTCTES